MIQPLLRFGQARLRAWQGDRWRAEIARAGRLPVFRLRTHHGTAPSFDLDQRRYWHGDGPGNLLLFLPAESSGYLIATAERGEGAPRIHLLPVWVQGRAQRGFCRLVQPFSTVFWSAEPPPAPGDPGALVTNRLLAGEWETFATEHVDPPPALAAEPLFQALRRLFRERPSPGRVVRDLAAGRSRHDPAALRAYLGALHFDLPAFGRALQARPEAARRLGGASDPWLAALPDLAAWEASRDPAPAPRRIGPDLDLISRVDDHPIALGRSLGVRLRQKVEPRRRACLVASARNEGPYLLEWIAHHRAVGFDHVFVYSNDNDDESDALLEALARQGVITWVDNAMIAAAPQQKCYAHAFSIMPDVLDYAWALVIDIDEFFAFDRRRYADLAAYLAWQGELPCDAIALNWLFFGTFGVRRYADRLVTRRFLTRFAAPDHHIKTMFRPRFFENSHCHYPYGNPGRPVIFRDSERNLYEHLAVFPHARHPVAERAWVNHYFSKSLDEALWKCARNLGDRNVTALRSPAEVAADVFSRVLSPEQGAATVADDRILGCVPDLEARVAALLDLPGVRPAATRVQEAFARRIGRMREEILGWDLASQEPRVQEMMRAMQRPDSGRLRAVAS